LGSISAMHAACRELQISNLFPSLTNLVEPSEISLLIHQIPDLTDKLGIKANRRLT